jgi:tetratricopeptide (TPR) repeat protein
MDDTLRRLITLGREHYRAHDFDAAEKCLREASSRHPGLADVWNMLGVIYHSRGELAEAERCFVAAVGINAGYTEAALNLAVTFNDLGKYREAREVYFRAMQRTRDEPRRLDPFVKGKLANMHADLGAAYAEVGLWPEAVREYQHALELCPGFVDLRTRVAQVYRDMGDLASAAHELEVVKAQSAGYLPARLALGSVLLSLGRRDDALGEWAEVLRQDPDNRLARLYLQMAKDTESGKVPEPPPRAPSAPFEDWLKSVREDE